MTMQVHLDNFIAALTRVVLTHMLPGLGFHMLFSGALQLLMLEMLLELCQQPLLLSLRENIGLIGFIRVGSRRVVQTAAIFMFFFSIFGKFGGILAAIPQPIVAAILCMTFGMVAGTGLSMLQFTNLNLQRNLFVVGFSIFLGLSVPQYFSEFTSQAYDVPVHTHVHWFNNILGSPIIITFLVACVLDSTLTWHVTRRDRGLLYTHRFESFTSDARNFEFYSLPFGLHKVFPPDSFGKTYKSS
jgi:hypothetical protein